MDRVATPQPLQIPSSPANTGFTPRQMLSMMPALLAAVLSVGTYSTSLLSAAFWTTEAMSLVSEKGYWVQA